MSDDYLWDRSGAPDPAVRHLERLLRPLAHVPRPLPESRSKRRFMAIAVVATAAALAAGILLLARPRPPGRATTGWPATALSGAPRLGEGTLAGQMLLGVGQWLETDRHSRAEVTVGRIGRVQIAPHTRVRLVDEGRSSHRLELARGTIEAFIWAPPGQFLIDTEAGQAVDLGCAYSLTVDDQGQGLLKVSSGWVGFEHQGLESFVPAGAACRTRPGSRPGTPYNLDAPATLSQALARFDFEPDAPARRAALAVVLSTARPSDAVTVWHLLARVAPADRRSVFARLAVLRPPPPGVTEEAILRGDRDARDLWWNALGLGPVEQWRRRKLARPPAGR